MRTSDENPDRRLSSRNLAAVNRKIAKLCDELDALQCQQGMLERDIAHRAQGKAGRGGRRGVKCRRERSNKKEVDQS